MYEPIFRRRMFCSTKVVVFSMIAIGFAGTYASAADVAVINNNDSGPGSLRAAIQSAASGDRIVFAPSVSSPINLASALPTIANDLTLFNQGVSAVMINRGIAGPINITNGTVDLGTITIQPGALTPDVQFGPTTTWIGNQSISANVQAEGVIAPGTSTPGSIGTLGVDGNINASNSQLQMDVRGDQVGQKDLIDATGIVDINNANLSPRIVGSDFEIGNTITLIRATNIQNNFSNQTEKFQLTQNPFLQASINLNIPLMELQLLIEDNNRPFADVIRGCNQTAVAAEVDRLRVAINGAPGTFGGIEADVDRLRAVSSTQMSTAFNELSGVIYPSIVDAEINHIHNNLISIRDRIVFQPEAFATVNQWTTWGRGYGLSGEVDTDTDGCLSPGYHQQLGGLELGTGYLHSSGLALHGFTHLAAAKTTIDGTRQRADTDTYQFGGSVQYVGSVAYVMAAGGGGFSNHDVTRSFDAVGTNASARGKLNGDDQFGYVEVGRGYGDPSSYGLTFVSLQGVHVNLDDVDETGTSNFRLSVNDIDGESLRSMIGASISKTNPTAIGPATTQARLGWLHEYLDESRQVDSRFNQVNNGVLPGFQIESVATDRDWLSAGLQLDWAFWGNGQFTAAYQGNLNSQSRFQSGFIGTRWVW